MYSFNGDVVESSATTPEENTMSRDESKMNRDQSKGRIEAAKGKARETVGKVIGNNNLELKGKLQKDLGKAQAAYGDLQERIRKAKPSP
jgi:uncharacterized protein YjbJ (UPF0337 family)